MYAMGTALFYCSSFWYPLSSRSLKVAYIWQIERLQKDAIKFKRQQIKFSSDVFIAIFVKKKIRAWGTAPGGGGGGTILLPPL